MAQSIDYFVFILTIQVMLQLILCRVTIKYNITEDKSTGYIIGNIPNDTNLQSHFSADVFPLITYKFLENSPYISYLHLDANTGVLKIQQALDREVICKTNSRPICDIKLYVATEPTAYRIIIEVTIAIRDVNDNTPKFEEQAVTIDISENIQPELAKYTLPQASDPDYGDNNIKGYSLVPSQQQFLLEVLHNPVGAADLHLKLQKRLDREQIDHYNLQVLAWDGGTPARTGTLNITINVLDSNDNAPQFTKFIYDVSVEENIPRGSTLVSVQAVDPDHNSNGDVIYTFSKSTSTAYGNLFDINEDTGEIYTVGELDYEQGNVYYLTVIASDKGINSFSSNAKVVINVTDKNDNAPVVTVSGLGEMGRVEILENSDPKIVIAIVDVIDPEGTPVTCSMSSQSFNLNQVNGNQYEIITATTFNREQDSIHRVTLSCYDRGKPVLMSTKNITVSVTDANDNAPVFTKKQYKTTVYENNGAGVSLLRVYATDLDIGENADITYSIRVLENETYLKESDRLMIFPKNGSIVTTGNFDRETQLLHKYLLMATDNGVPNLNATATLNIYVLDVNDEPPRFTVSDIKFGTFENQPKGTEIGTVFATDADLPPFDNITYSIVSSTKDSNAFTINETTGKITTKKMLDREASKEFHLVIKASNPDKPSLYTKANITIYVADKNDNAPYINFPQPGNNTVRIKGHMKKGNTVTYVLAQDADLGKNAALTYSITDGDDEGLFDVDMEGKVFLTRDLDLPGGVTIFGLDITVSDKGDIPLHSTHTLRIVVNTTAIATKKSNSFINLTHNTNIAIVVLCSVLVVIVFAIILVLILLVLRRKKDQQSRLNRSNPDRQQNTGSCMETTKALLTIGGMPQPPNVNGEDEPEASPEHESMDSGVDMPPMEDPRQGNRDMLTWGKQRNRQCQQSPDMSALMEKPYVRSGVLPVINEHHVDCKRQPPTQQHKPYTAKSPGQMTEIQLRVHEMMYNTNNMAHDDSSASDSGKGPSEEGDIRDIPEEIELTDIKFSPTYGTSPGYSKSQYQHYSPLKYQPLQTNSPTHAAVPMYARSQTFPKKTQACKPILKPSQKLVNEQDHSGHQQTNCLPQDCYPDQNSDAPDNAINGNNKKKTVHFVKPYSLEKDSPTVETPPENTTKHLLQNKPSYIYCPSPKPLQTKMRGMKKKGAQNQPGLSSFSATSPMTESNKRPSNHQYFDIWTNEREHDLDSQDGCSDGGTTTSGSYCVDTIAEEQALDTSGCFSIDGYPSKKTRDVFV